MGSKYKCFQFNEESLLEKPVGPAYNPKIEYDLKIDNGANAKESNRLKIKVRKIKAVKKIEDNLYSESEYYWFYEDSGMIYDYDLQFPVGKVELDESSKPVKIDNDTFVIGDVIDIPEFKIY
jgi:hypothetical protein